MKTLIIAVIVVIVVIVAYVFLPDLGQNKTPEITPSLGNRFERDGQEWARFSDEDLGLMFEYRQNPDGYILTEPKIDDAEIMPVRSLIMISQKDHEELLRETGARDGPVSINIMVFSTETGVLPIEWIKQNPRWSNYIESVNLENVEIDGNDSVRFDWDGLYRGQTVALIKNQYVYLFMATYLEKSDMIFIDFEELLSSVRLN